MTSRWLVASACSLVAACGGGGSSTEPDAAPVCANLGSSTWVGTEDVTTTSGTCTSFPGLSVTFTFTQAAGSCSFQLVNSRVAGITFTGTVSGNTVTWTHDPYPYGGGTLTLDSVDATLSADLSTLSGDFKWTLAKTPSGCTGTTTFHVVRQ